MPDPRNPHVRHSGVDTYSGMYSVQPAVRMCPKVPQIRPINAMNAMLWRVLPWVDPPSILLVLLGGRSATLKQVNIVCREL